MIDSTECTEPQESYTDENKIRVPDFRFKYIESVKECAKAADWTLVVNDYNENTYGEGAVIDQSPEAGTDVDPDKVEITLDVSTGNPS